MSRSDPWIDTVIDLPVRGHARQSAHGCVLAGVARGIEQLFPPVFSSAEEWPTQQDSVRSAEAEGSGVVDRQIAIIERADPRRL